MDADKKNSFGFIGNGDTAWERNKDIFTAGQDHPISHLIEILSQEKCGHHGEALFHEVMDFSTFI
jgi:hypothetical protein